MNQNNKVSLSDLIVKRLYYQYQDFLIPGITILVCFLLFWFVVLGQIQNWFATRDTIAINAQDLAVMHQNLSTITNFNDAQLDQVFQTATAALPTEKDFAGIIASLQTAASVAGTSLDDYAFQLGNIAGLDEKGQPSQLPVQLNVMIRGGAKEAEQFIHQLKNQLPLADATAVVVNQNTTVSITVIFYYATLPKIAFVNTTPLPALSKGDQMLLTTLAAESSISNVTLSSGSAAAQPSVTPTPTVITTPTPVATTSAQ